MAKRRDPARDRVARLLRLARGRRRAVIAVQDHPDPDGIASAAALKRLLQEKTGAEVVLAAAGQIGRAENRAALQFLGETLDDIATLDLPAFDLRAIVDAQPGFGNNSWPDAQLATALLYGIKTDTQDLSRGAAPADTEAFLYLYPRANHRLLAKIERERLPRAYFATLARALSDCRIYDNVAICSLGPVEAPDILGELADFFLRIEGIRWVLCHGRVADKLHLSVRTILRQGKAGGLAARLLDEIGSGGGHDMLAGGHAALPTDLDGDGRADPVEATVREIELRFLRQTGVSTRTPEFLVPRAPAHPPGESAP